MSDYIKLAEAPTFTVNTPTCNACCVEVDADADGLICPCCGTMWGHRDGEGDLGTLYEDYSGEGLPGDALSESEAWRAGIDYSHAEHAANMARIEEHDAKAKFLAAAMADPVGQRLAAEAVALAEVKK